ncbi:hypothetical protein B0H13DRAFT_1856302 [Mycena leptocephala]|nr:hypothetical protein B0H13DRAFT_1856302 [Mycena leptocephala]
MEHPKLDLRKARQEWRRRKAKASLRGQSYELSVLKKEELLLGSFTVVTMKILPNLNPNLVVKSECMKGGNGDSGTTMRLGGKTWVENRTHRWLAAGIEEPEGGHQRQEAGI